MKLEFNFAHIDPIVIKNRYLHGSWYICIGKNERAYKHISAPNIDIENASKFLLVDVWKLYTLKKL